MMMTSKRFKWQKKFWVFLGALALMFGANVLNAASIDSRAPRDVLTLRRAEREILVLIADIIQDRVFSGEFTTGQGRVVPSLAGSFAELSRAVPDAASARNTELRHILLRKIGTMIGLRLRAWMSLQRETMMQQNGSGFDQSDGFASVMTFGSPRALEMMHLQGEVVRLFAAASVVRHKGDWLRGLQRFLTLNRTQLTQERSAELMALFSGIASEGVPPGDAMYQIRDMLHNYVEEGAPSVKRHCQRLLAAAKPAELVAFSLVNPKRQMALNLRATLRRIAEERAEMARLLRREISTPAAVADATNQGRGARVYQLDHYRKPKAQEPTE